MDLDDDTLGYLFQIGIDTFFNPPWSKENPLQGPLEKWHMQLVVHGVVQEHFRHHFLSSSDFGDIQAAELWMGLQALGRTSKQHAIIWRREREAFMSQKIFLPECGHTNPLYDKVPHPLLMGWRNAWIPSRTDLEPVYDKLIHGKKGDVCDVCEQRRVDAMFNSLYYYDSDGERRLNDGF